MRQEKANVGDVIVCRGRRVEITEILSQFEEDGFWYIEGRNQNGSYFYWKQKYDGGKLIRAWA